MESTRRLIVKSLTWQGLGLIVMGAVGYAFTGSLATGGGMALTLSAIGLVTYVLHERLWARVGWGRASAPRRAEEAQQAGGALGDVLGRSGV